MTKTFQALDNYELDQWLDRAVLFQERGLYSHLDVYKLAEILYNKSIEANEKNYD